MMTPTLTASVERLGYGPDDAAVALGLGRTKTFELIRTGELRSIKVGRRRLIPVDALHEFLARSASAS